MSDTLYSLLSINPESSAYDIEGAGKALLRQLNPTVLKQFLNARLIDYTQDDVLPLMSAIKEYIDDSVSLLLEPATKDCYDCVMNATTPEMQTLAAARVSYLNTQDGIRFDKSIYEHLPQARKEFEPVQRPSKCLKMPDLKCRWCTNTFQLTDYAIYQCKCSARIGHSNCAKSFAKEYKNKCPVCRTKLLARWQISKYMFWGIDNKFKI
jgi:hypothetical protein